MDPEEPRPRLRPLRLAGPSLAWVVFLLACAPRAPEPEPTAGKPTSLASPTTAVRAPTPAPTPAAPEGQDFAAEVRLAYQVVACGDDAPSLRAPDLVIWRQHCAALAPRIESYRKKYLSVAAPFLARLQPAGLPTTVVYPFGGGDLLSALTTYPDATDITTLSLELTGDPRRLGSLEGGALTGSLGQVRRTVAPLLALENSTSATLMRGQRGDIPGQLAFFLVALAAHGQEPVSLRYFRIEADGGLHYYSADEIVADDRETARSLKGSWTPPDFAPTFANAEIAFRPRGSPDAPLRVHRHVAANLADGPLRKEPGVLRYLERKGRVVAMTKAASYLLWRPDFALMRQYLLENMEFMVSDSTGIPPSFAKRAGFVQETYGTFQGSFLRTGRVYNDEFRELWRSQPARPLPFRYGYPDSAHHFHLVVTRRAATP